MLKNKYIYSFCKSLICLILLILLNILLISSFRVSIINGHSMDNTLFDGERLILNVRAYKKEMPKYKDIIVIRRDDFAVKYIIKRVIGVPGDNLKIKDNKLYINNKLINEDYIKEEMITEDIEITIPDDKLFVMGDNRNHSLDSRNMNVVGLINCKTQPISKAIFSLSKFKPMNN